MFSWCWLLIKDESLPQDCDNRLKELAARVHDLKKSEEETISAEVTLTVDAVARELDR